MPYDSEVASKSTQSDDPNGVVLGQFSLKSAKGTFDNVWNSEKGDTPITFFQSNGTGGSNAIGNFLPLGDFVVLVSYPENRDPVAPGTQVLFAPARDSTVLKHPEKFDWILDSHGSGNDRKIAYYTIVPPPGYKALGIAFGNANDLPDPTLYWCVRHDLVRAVETVLYWSDAGQGWQSHNGNLLLPVANLAPIESPILFAPPTFLSEKGGNEPYALVIS